MQFSPTPDEWRNWLRENGRRFLLYARQQTRSESDAEDILQDAIVEAWQRSRGVPPDPLVFSTIRRRAIDLARSVDRRALREEQQQPETPWFTPEVENRETQRLLELAVNALPENYREVVSLKVWGGLTFQQIAEVTGVPLNTAASRYRYAVEELRQNLKGVLSVKDPIEEALEKLQPNDLPPALMARLTAARPQPRETVQFWRRWLVPLAAGVCAAVAAVAWLKPNPPTPSGPHIAVTAPVPFERNDFLIGTREVGTFVTPDQRPYRIMQVEWLERETVRPNADGPAIRIDTKRREVIPVAMEIF